MAPSEGLKLISVVSHGQAHEVARLLADVASHCDPMGLSVVVTLNVPEPVSFEPESFPFPVFVIRNGYPKGFAANHNSAFAVARSDWFCVINPDVRINDDPFPTLLKFTKEAVALSAPLAMTAAGEPSDNARQMPTPTRILRRVLTGGNRSDYCPSVVSSPDWVAGVFMLFASKAFRSVGGFDDTFYMYCEDVDICARLRLSGHDIAWVPDARVVHEARRRSRSHPRYFFWHVTGLIRIFSRYSRMPVKVPA
jgi:N-acetylglucosaminyl-diphospho-decaprenol L-rhamnosyltransferase